MNDFLNDFNSGDRMNIFKGNVAKKAKQVLTEFRISIKKGKGAFAVFVGVFLLLTIFITLVLISLGDENSEFRNPLSVCLFGCIGCFSTLFGIKNAYKKPDAFGFSKNSVKRWYHNKNKPEKYEKICWVLFFSCFLFTAFAGFYIVFLSIFL